MLYLHFSGWILCYLCSTEKETTCVACVMQMTWATSNDRIFILWMNCCFNVSFIFPVGVSTPACETALRLFMKTDSVCVWSQWEAPGSMTSLTLRWEQRNRPSSAIEGICVKKPITAGLSPPRSSRTRRGQRDHSHTNLHWSVSPSVEFIAFICRALTLQNHYKSPQDSI